MNPSNSTIEWLLDLAVSNVVVHSMASHNGAMLSQMKNKPLHFHPATLPLALRMDSSYFQRLLTYAAPVPTTATDSLMAYRTLVPSISYQYPRRI